jgi:hypothetical protein
MYLCMLASRPIDDFLVSVNLRTRGHERVVRMSRSDVVLQFILAMSN